MTTKTNSIIESRDYDLIGILDDEQDCLESVANEYSGSTYLCDAISEASDSYTPIYNSDIWKNAGDIQEYVEDGISEGLAPVEGRDVDLTKILQVGYYVYYNRSLYNNLDTIAFNYVADKVNEFLDGLDEDVLSEIDTDDIEDTIEEETANTDNNDRYDDLDDKANDIIGRIKDNEFGGFDEEDED